MFPCISKHHNFISVNKSICLNHARVIMNIKIYYNFTKKKKYKQNKKLKSMWIEHV